MARGLAFGYQALPAASGFAVVRPTPEEIAEWCEDERRRQCGEISMLSGRLKPEISFVPRRRQGEPPLPRGLYLTSDSDLNKRADLAFLEAGRCLETDNEAPTDLELERIRKFYSIYGCLGPLPNSQRDPDKFFEAWEKGESLSVWQRYQQSFRSFLNAVRTGKPEIAASLFDLNKIGRASVKIANGRGALRSRAVEMVMEFDSLADFMWCTLLRTYATGGSLEPCAKCGKLMALGEKAEGRQRSTYTNRRTCSDKCRRALSRLKQRTSVPYA